MKGQPNLPFSEHKLMAKMEELENIRAYLKQGESVYRMQKMRKRFQIMKLFEKVLLAMDLPNGCFMEIRFYKGGIEDIRFKDRRWNII
jgi:hypothetical protein